MEPVTKNLPVIAMRGLNVFPRMNTSFDLERPISVHALERAMENGEEIFLVTQREIGVEQPEEKDLYEIGTVARVTQILRVSDRVLRVMMEGACRARLKRLWQREPFLQAQVELIDEPATSRQNAALWFICFRWHISMTSLLKYSIAALVQRCLQPSRVSAGLSM